MEGTEDRARTYETPRALRLSAVASGIGYCSTGSDDQEWCGAGYGAAASGCDPGQGATGADCQQPGSLASMTCIVDGNSADWHCETGGTPD